MSDEMTKEQVTEERLNQYLAWMEWIGQTLHSRDNQEKFKKSLSWIAILTRRGLSLEVVQKEKERADWLLGALMRRIEKAMREGSLNRVNEAMRDIGYLLNNPNVKTIDQCCGQPDGAFAEHVKNTPDQEAAALQAAIDQQKGEK